MSPLEPDSATLVLIRALLARHRAEGLDGAEARRRILDELRASISAEAVENDDLGTIVARWQWAIEQVSCDGCRSSSAEDKVGKRVENLTSLESQAFDFRPSAPFEDVRQRFRGRL
ncbi:hypothetical protein ACYOEI_12165 [Singulisphaera rosea]